MTLLNISFKVHTKPRTVTIKPLYLINQQSPETVESAVTSNLENDFYNRRPQNI